MIKFVIDGKEINPRNLNDAIMAAVLESIRNQIQALAAGLRSNVCASRWTMAPPFLMTICAVKALEPSLQVRPMIVPML